MSVYSEAQRRYFGAELARRKKGLKPKMKGFPTARLAHDLRAAAGKKLPTHSKGGKPGTGLNS
jgi:hypothetical protein